MSIEEINKLIKEISNEIAENAIKGNLPSHDLLYDQNGYIRNLFNEIYSFYGIYLFTIEKGKKRILTYAGKSEGSKRLSNHITGKNKDGSPLAKSVKHKHQKIKDAIRSGYSVKVHLYSNNQFEKSSLSCIEIQLLEICRKSFLEHFSDSEKWIERIG